MKRIIFSITLASLFSLCITASENPIKQTEPTPQEQEERGREYWRLMTEMGGQHLRTPEKHVESPDALPLEKNHGKSKL